jgi:ribose/xylose/arabinose/galactoside ABC-type transport system permease subunit
MEKLFRLPDFGKGIESYLIPVYHENPRWSLYGRLIRAGFVLMALVSLSMVALPLYDGIFFSLRNLRNLSGQMLPAVLAASVMVFLFSRGGIDLSFMLVGALAGTITAVSLSMGIPLPLAVILSIVTGLIIGFFNGALVGLFSIPGILVTLLSGVLARMISLLLNKGETLMLDLGPEANGMVLGFMKVCGWLISLVLLSAGIFCFYFPSVLQGRKKEKIPESYLLRALRLALPYVVSGGVAACAGIYLTFYIMASSPGQGMGGEIDLLFLLVFGGAVFGSRSGNPVAVYLAALCLGVIRNVTSLMNFPYAATFLLILILVFLALVFNIGFETIVGYFYSKGTKGKQSEAADGSQPSKIL